MSKHKILKNDNGDDFGSYTIDDGLVTAHHPSGKTKSTEVGNSGPEWVARDLMRAIERDLEKNNFTE